MITRISPVFAIVLLLAAAAEDSTPPSALDIFRLLPVTIFENTPEGISEGEKQTLIENSRTGLWRLIPVDSDELRVESRPDADSSVTVRLFHGRGMTVAAEGAQTRDTCALELWVHDDRHRLTPYPLPPDPLLRDFFGPDNHPPAGLDHSIRICLAADVLRAYPLFTGPGGPTAVSLDNAVFFRWTGGGFEKAVLPLAALQRGEQPGTDAEPPRNAP